MNKIIFDRKTYMTADMDLALAIASRCTKTAKVFDAQGNEVFRQWHDRSVKPANIFRRPPLSHNDVRLLVSNTLTIEQVYAIFNKG